MELFFLLLLLVLMAAALGSGYPVAFALPGVSILTILLAGGAGYVFEGNTDAFFAQGGPSQWLSAGITNLRGVYWEPERDTLIAVPLFIFMGIMLQRSKIAEDLLVTMARLFGQIPGGLGISVVVVGALLAATTGIVGATVVAMGLISLPAMMKNNYSQPLATGTIVASGTLGQIIPPSIVLIILADQLSNAADQASTLRKTLYRDVTGELSMPSMFDVVSTSAGEMFLGAFVPGLVLVVLYILYILGFSLINPGKAPPLPKSEKNGDGVVLKALGSLAPPLVLIFLVLGSIIAGVATVNQAGAIGAAGAIIMAGYRLREASAGAYRPAILGIASFLLLIIVLQIFDTNIRTIQSPRDKLGVGLALFATLGLVTSLIWSVIRVQRTDNTLHQVMLETAKATSLVFIILLGAAILTAAFRSFGGEELVRHFLEGLPGGFWFKFAVVMAVIFILGFFLDYIEIAVVVVPIVAPILLSDPDANISAVWLGVMIGLNIQTSFLTPPFGFALFYLRGIAPAAIKTINIYKGVVPFILLQLCAMLIVAQLPVLVNYLPNRISLLSENASPPRNPRLSYCVDGLIDSSISENRNAILELRAQSDALDFQTLPEPIMERARTAYSDIERVLELHDKALSLQTELTVAAQSYAPVHRFVRALQRDVRRLDREIAFLQAGAKRSKRLGDQATAAQLEHQIGPMIANREELLGKVPEEWPSLDANFAEVRTVAATARREYENLAQEIYANLTDITSIFAANTGFADLEEQLSTVTSVIASEITADLQTSIAALADKFGDVAGAKPIRDALSQARREMRSKSSDPELAVRHLTDARELYDAQRSWRATAETALGETLEMHTNLLSSSFGIRLQDRFERDQAISVARCLSDHRSLSLEF